MQTSVVRARSHYIYIYIYIYAVSRVCVRLCVCVCVCMCVCVCVCVCVTNAAFQYKEGHTVWGGCFSFAQTCFKTGMHFSYS